MTEGNDDPKPPAAAPPAAAKHPAPTALRLDAEAAAALDALVAAAGPKTSRHRLMVVALTHGARALAADRAALVRMLLGAPIADALDAERRPVAVVPTPVAASSTPADGGAPAPRPQAPPAAPPAPPPAVEVDAAAEGEGADDDPRRYATPAELARLRRALVAASKRGASILAIATAARVNTGGARRALGAVARGESPRVTLRVVSAATAAAEAWGA